MSVVLGDGAGSALRGADSCKDGRLFLFDLFQVRENTLKT